MRYSIILHTEAEKEYLSSLLWYEKRSPGLGEEFAQSVENKIQSIIKNPLHYPEKKKNYHEARVGVFPFLIVYKIYPEKKIIFVVSIFHTSRKLSKKYRDK